MLKILNNRQKQKKKNLALLVTPLLGFSEGLRGRLVINCVPLWDAVLIFNTLLLVNQTSAGTKSLGNRRCTAVAALGEGLRRNENRKRDKRHGSVLGISPAACVQRDGLCGGHLHRLRACHIRRCC